MLWVKALHIVFVISWMAGMLYLPRLFVYHTEVSDEIGHQRFCVMEKRLYTLTLIAMIGTWVLGIWLLLLLPGYLQTGWMHAKLALVIALSGYHGWLKGRLRAFANRKNTRSARYYRIANEVPAVLMLVVVILVVVKPF
ncbi:MAG: protoporphyrinogen oxidase HemJ [Stagnimonas sp.]|nr:protoporphyrinogen oxidase HemJ [Stagnimonas sp.]